MTITGGKWTTYRKMAEDCVDFLIRRFDLPKNACQTNTLLLRQTLLDEKEWNRQTLDEHNTRLHPQLGLTQTDLLKGIRFEYARTVEDLLARRTRALFLNSTAAMHLAPMAASLLRTELHRDAKWEAKQLEQFETLAKSYLVES